VSVGGDRSPCFRSPWLARLLPPPFFLGNCQGNFSFVVILTSPSDVSLRLGKRPNPLLPKTSPLHVYPPAPPLLSAPLSLMKVNARTGLLQLDPTLQDLFSPTTGEPGVRRPIFVPIPRSRQKSSPWVNSRRRPPVPPRLMLFYFPKNFFFCFRLHNAAPSWLRRCCHLAINGSLLIIHPPYPLAHIGRFLLPFTFSPAFSLFSHPACAFSPVFLFSTWKVPSFREGPNEVPQLRHAFMRVVPRTQPAPGPGAVPCQEFSRSLLFLEMIRPPLISRPLGPLCCVTPSFLPQAWIRISLFKWRCELPRRCGFFVLRPTPVATLVFFFVELEILK